MSVVVMIRGVHEASGDVGNDDQVAQANMSYVVGCWTLELGCVTTLEMILERVMRRD